MANEREILRLEAERLEQDGYTVVLEPSRSVLPDDLKDIRPDAIAVGKEPFLLVEVVSERVNSARIRRFQEALKAKPNWKLHLIYAGTSHLNELALLPLMEIQQSTKLIPSVAGQDTRAALLLCWAHLEALARALQPRTFSRPQSPGRVVEQLAGIAYVTAGTAEFLRRMAAKRNEFIHGGLRAEVDQKDIDTFVKVLNTLVDEARAENVP